MRLMLIRHGQTPNNVTGALDTALPGAGLTELGRRQAEAVPEALADVEIAGVYASRLVRTQLTAAPLGRSRGLPVEVVPGLEEIPAGGLELRTDHDSRERYTTCLLRWMRGDLEHRLPGGLSGAEFLARYDEAVRSVMARHDPTESVALFTHGAAIRVYTALAVGLDHDDAEALSIHNTGMSVLEARIDGPWSLVQWSSDPLGGPGLRPRQAHDVTGESVDAATDDDRED